jgi:hypothetical protein
MAVQLYAGEMVANAHEPNANIGFNTRQNKAVYLIG